MKVKSLTTKDDDGFKTPEKIFESKRHEAKGELRRSFISAVSTRY